ncbi:cation transporter [Nocardioides sp. zg-ZUI104]|uniref:cation diffusion facilitator family transporter n=1 Tax=Nocardioides faecalis TaxID=2803858 RepID=UPI001BCBEDD4|nr:cation diffusion facilitator family transporter [Nocardioides faecalis]MBS4753772.1 cation transporter [Nocardioides faecalis]
MGAGHGHGHGHTPGHASSDGGNRTRLLIALGLASVLVLAQAVGSVVTGSLALLTDTAHALADASGLVVAVLAATLMTRPPTSRRTWGLTRVEVIAALGQSALLVAVGAYTAVEGVRRLIAPPEVASTELLVFGVVGLLLNLAAVAVLASCRTANLNLRAAFLEVLNDALGSLGVVVAAVVIATTGFQRADAIAALLIAALIVPRAFLLGRDTLRVLLEFAPAGVDVAEVERHISALDHVRDVHDLHASTIGSGLPVLSGHVVVDEECFTGGGAMPLLDQIRECVSSHFPVPFEHVTIQLEALGPGRPECPLAHCARPPETAHR